MKDFLSSDFLLETKTAQQLYHDYAEGLPIIDYHSHLSPKDIVENRVFPSITEAWLEGDHYKWRAMRANGINEQYCTGEAAAREKFVKWAETVPYTMRNPLYHWTHLELKRYFGIDQLLSPSSAGEIFENSSEQLQSMGTQTLLNKMKVEVVCTTDDPLDSLEYHQAWKKENSSLSLLPTFRPDKVLMTSDPIVWNKYIDDLANIANLEIRTFDDLLNALKGRHDFFHEIGCRLSDNGLEQLYSEDYTLKEVGLAFEKLRKSTTVSQEKANKFQSAVLFELAIMNHEKGWVQQYHLGAIRNNNARMVKTLGPDTGFDSMGDFVQVTALSKFLSRLDDTNQLTKTIVYNLNPAYNEVFATMVGNFNDGSEPGKMQFGSAWWFLDQKHGMEAQMNVLSNMGLLSRFVGMLTDSRSFLSFPRHEYFRRVLCNLFGNDVERGELPNDVEWIGKLTKDICYFNAKKYFPFNVKP